MEAVLKVGGSLTKKPQNLTKLCHQMSKLSGSHKICIVPGGAQFADTVREIDNQYEISKKVAHKMAILAMDQYGLFLSDMTPDSYLCYKLREANKSRKAKLPIFLPSQLMFNEDPLENSWDVTSDSIAAYIARQLQAEKLVLVTDVDGVFLEDPKTSKSKMLETVTAKELQNWNKRTSVDKMLPKILLKTKMQCFVVNGNYPERIQEILENKKSICTQIKGY